MINIIDEEIVDAETKRERLKTIGKWFAVRGLIGNVLIIEDAVQIIDEYINDLKEMTPVHILKSAE